MLGLKELAGIALTLKLFDMLIVVVDLVKKLLLG